MENSKYGITCNSIQLGYFNGGMIDHNFAANSLIPAINKAVSTGQAKLSR